MANKSSLNRFARRLSVILIMALVIALVPLNKTAAFDNNLASNDDPAIPLAWMQLLYQRIQAEAMTPPVASRVFAYAGIALYESVRPGMPGYVSLAGQLNTMPPMPTPDKNTVYDWPSSANAALAEIAAGLLSDKSRPAISDLRYNQAIARKSSVSMDVIDQSVAYGDAVGRAILKWAATDNFDKTRTMTYTLPSGKAADWVPTTPGAKPIEPYWGMQRTFALKTVDTCEVPLNITFDTDKTSTFYAQAMEVKNSVDNLTDDQKAIVKFWADNAGASGTPGGHWILIANQVATQLKLHLDRVAEMYAVLGITLGDAFIACWNVKYQAVLLRPVTYINTYIASDWKTFIGTPSFPSYPSGHSVVSAAAAEILTGLFGTVAFTDNTHQADSQAARHFTSFNAAASEAAMSRLYAGIHYRIDIENGLKQGECIGQQVLSAIHLHG